MRASEFTDIFSDFLSVSITLFFDLGSNALEIFGSDVSDSLNIFSCRSRGGGFPGGRLRLSSLMSFILASSGGL